jgi:HlyD family secretion protein
VNRSALRLGGALLLLVAIAAGIAIRRARKPPISAPKPTVVSSIPVTEISLSGRVEARTTVFVAAPMGGTLDAWFVDVNQEVYEDQLVGRIRNPEREEAVRNAQRDLEKADARMADLDMQGASTQLEVSRTAAEQSHVRSELDRVEKIYQRQKMLMDVGATPRLTFEKSESEYNAAKAAVEKADAGAKEATQRAAALQKDLESTRASQSGLTKALEKAKAAAAECDLHSPADGIVVSRRAQLHDPVEASKDILEIASNLTSLSVAAPADPAVIARIRAGQQATIKFPDSEAPGVVREVRGSDVIVDFTSPGPAPKIGTSAQVRIKQ